MYERESLVEKALIRAVELRGGICYKFVSPGRAAVPDRLCVLPFGVSFFVECKAPGKQPTAAQAREHARLEARGQRVFVLADKHDAEPLLIREYDAHRPNWRLRKAANDETF